MEEVTNHMFWDSKQAFHQAQQVALQGRPVGWQTSLVDCALHVVVQIFYRVQLRRIGRQIKHLDLVGVGLDPRLDLWCLVSLQAIGEVMNWTEPSLLRAEI